MAPKKTAPTLSKDEKKAQGYIDIGFEPHKGPWNDTAKKLVEGYNGKYWEGTEQRHRFKVNTLASLANLMLPNFIFDAPYVRVIPKSGKYYKKLIDGAYLQVDNYRAAHIKEAALNHVYQKIDAVGEQRKAVLDSFFYGFGITKVGYSYETATDTDYDYVVKDTPFLKRVKPQDFGWHPLASGLDDSCFLIHRTITTLDRLKKVKRYKNLASVSAEVPTHIKDRMAATSGQKWLEGWLSLYEVHDLEQDKIYTFAGESKILIDVIEKPYKFTGHFSMIRFLSDNEKFEGIPLLGLVYDEAIALNEIMTLIVEHFRKFPGQMFINKGAAEKDDIIRIRNGEQGSVHIVNDINGMTFKPPLNMGGEYFNLVNLFQVVMDKTLGIPDFQRATSNVRKSATEATFVQGDASIRRQYALKLVKEFMLDGARKLSSIQEQFQDDKEFVQASGDLKGMSFEFDKRDLKYFKAPEEDADDALFQYDFDIDSLKLFNEAQVNGLNNALQIIAQIPELKPGLRSLNAVKAVKMIFKGFGLNIEALQSDSVESTVFVNPELENDIARNPHKHKNQPMPSPKAGEDHSWHIEIHKGDLQVNGMNEQILEHLAETVMMQQQEEGPQVPQQPQPPEVGVPQGPMGPMQSMPPIPMQ